MLVRISKHEARQQKAWHFMALSVRFRHRASALIANVLLGSLALLAVLATAPAHAADRVIATSPLGPTPGETLLSSVEAHGGNLVWGENQTFEGPFDYVVRDARGTRRILPGIFPKDLDLGARRGGGTEAVFMGIRVPGRHELFTYDLRSGTVRSLASLWRPRGREQHPSVWKGRFAFERVIEVNDINTPKPPARSLGLFATSPRRAVTRAKIVDTDLRGSRLAYVTLAAPAEQTRGTTTVRVTGLPGGRGRVRSCFIARATARGRGPNVALSSPVLTGSYVYWLRTDLRNARGTIRRRRLPGRGCRLSGREERSREIVGMESFAVDGRRFYYTTQAQVREATDPPLAFSR